MNFVHEKHIIKDNLFDIPPVFNLIQKNQVPVEGNVSGI